MRALLLREGSDVGMFYVIRHCEAEGQAANAALTARGREQAALLAERLAGLGIGRIISSPYRRAVETAKPLARRLGLPVETDARLVERVLAGEDMPDWREKLARTFDDPDLCYAGGESSRQATDRALSVAESALAAAEGVPFALVTHGCLATLLLRAFDPAVGFADWARMTNPDVYRVTARGPESRVERIWPGA